MRPPRLIARHLAHPQGLVGTIVGFLMNRHNARMNQFALAALDVRSPDQVLEIGFGGGVALPALLASAAHVIGLDRSTHMVRRAARRYRSEVEAGRAEFLVGAIEALPFENGRFDKLYSVNTVYFWTSLAVGAREARRALKDGGRLVIGLLPGDVMARLGYPEDIFTCRSIGEVQDALERAGFGSVNVRRPAETAWAVITAS